MNRIAIPFLLLCLSLAACGEVAPAEGDDVATAAQALTVDDIYAKLSSAQGLLTVPPPSATLTVGTIEALTGEFTGLTSTYIDPEPGEKPHPPVPAHATLDAINATLRFNILHRGTKAFWVTANGRTVVAPAGATSVEVEVGRDRTVSWTLHAGVDLVSDSLIISRPNAFGAGAFTVKVLPIVIVYEPPMDAALTNFAQMEIATQTSSSVTLTSGSDKSTTTPNFSMVGAMSSVLSAVAGKTSGTASTLLGAAAGVIGSVSSTSTEGTTVNSDHSLGLSTVAADTYGTARHGGPGIGDVFFYYRDAKVAWAMLDGQVSLALMDHGPMGQVTAEVLKNDLATLDAGGTTTVSMLDRTGVEALLGLDPFVASPLFPSLPSSRFEFVQTLDPIAGGTLYETSVEHSHTTSDKTATQAYQSTVVTSAAGWLSAIGIGGVTSTGTTKTTFTHGASRATSLTTSRSALLHLASGIGESYGVDIYYDRLFDSFAIRKRTTLVFPGPFHF